MGNNLDYRIRMRTALKAAGSGKTPEPERKRGGMVARAEKLRDRLEDYFLAFF